MLKILVIVACWRNWQKSVMPEWIYDYMGRSSVSEIHCGKLDRFQPRLWGTSRLVCLFGFLTSSSTTRLLRTGPKTERLTILRAATHETELGDHDFCLSRSHHTDTDSTSGEWAATAGIEPRTSSPGVARSTAPPRLVWALQWFRWSVWAFFGNLIKVKN